MMVSMWQGFVRLFETSCAVRLVGVPYISEGTYLGLFCFLRHLVYMFLFYAYSLQGSSCLGPASQVSNTKYEKMPRHVASALLASLSPRSLASVA
jgi:hypothetical protein